MSHSELVSELMELRSNWDIQDFKDAYSDEWDEFPESLNDCKDRMEEHINHTYDTDYIQECIENEKVSVSFDSWSAEELADALIECYDFLEEHVTEGEEDNVWQWDRSDLIGYAYDYLNQD